MSGETLTEALQDAASTWPTPLGEHECRDLALALSGWMKRHDAEVRAEERERIARAIEALPTTRTKAWTKGWDSVSLADALATLAPATRASGLVLPPGTRTTEARHECDGGCHINCEHAEPAAEQDGDDR